VLFFAMHSIMQMEQSAQQQKQTAMAVPTGSAPQYKQTAIAAKD
jgi:hypothetical protein